MADDETDPDGELRFFPYARAEELLRRVANDREAQSAAARLSVARRRGMFALRVLGTVSVALVALIVLVIVTDLVAVSPVLVGVGVVVCAAGTVALAVRDRLLRRRAVDAHLTIGVPVPKHASGKLADAAINLTVVADNLKHIVTIPYPPTTDIIKRVRQYRRQLETELDLIRETWVAGDERAWFARCRSAGPLWLHRTSDLHKDLVMYIRYSE